MARRKIMICVAAIAILLMNPAGEVFASGEMKKGNRLYSEKKYEEALENYDLAISGKPEDAIAQYNRAAALYRMDKFTEAEVGFLNSLAMGADKIEEESAYNAANSKYRLGASMEGANSASAMENYKQASQFYKRAMELAPEDIDAKYNYEFLLKKIKELEEKMKQEKKNDQKPCKDKKKDEQKKEEEKKKDEKKKDEQQKSKGEKKKKDEEKKEEEKQKSEAAKKEDKEKKDEQKDREEKSDAEKKKEDQKEKEKAEEKKKKEAKEKEEEEKQKEAESQKAGEEESSDEQSSADSQAAKNETPVGEMTKEEAQILLMGQEEEEERMRAEKRKARSRNRPAVLKDW